jgi:hypothetical protein
MFAHHVGHKAARSMQIKPLVGLIGALIAAPTVEFNDGVTSAAAFQSRLQWSSLKYNGLPCHIALQLSSQSAAEARISSSHLQCVADWGASSSAAYHNRSFPDPG